MIPSETSEGEQDVVFFSELEYLESYVVQTNFHAPFSNNGDHILCVCVPPYTFVCQLMPRSV